MKQWAKDLIANNKVAAIPIMTHPGIELIGKTVRDAVTDGQVPSKPSTKNILRQRHVSSWT